MIRRSSPLYSFEGFLGFTVGNSLRFSLVFHPKLIMLCIIERTVLPPPCQPLLNLQPKSLG